MLTLNDLLLSAGLDPKGAVVLRHRPMEPALRKVLPWIAAERPDLFITYQQFQWISLEKAMTRATTIVSFIGEEAGRATFAGLFAIAGAEPTDHAAYWAIPGNNELHALGMAGMAPESPPILKFDLTPRPKLAEWQGRLIVRWPPPERSWWRWADRNVIPIDAIVEESRFGQAMPPWDQWVLSWRELQLLPPRWRAALAEWRGVYFIFDRASGKGYVGSAYGADNLLGRWSNYAASGHGGNKLLRRCKPEDLQFSILQRTSPDLAPAEVIRLETSWKERLHTRVGGLNDN